MTKVSHVSIQEGVEGIIGREGVQLEEGERGVLRGSGSGREKRSLRSRLGAVLP